MKQKSQTIPAVICYVFLIALLLPFLVNVLFFLKDAHFDNNWFESFYLSSHHTRIWPDDASWFFDTVYHNEPMDTSFIFNIFNIQHISIHHIRCCTLALCFVSIFALNLYNTGLKTSAFIALFISVIYLIKTSLTVNIEAYGISSMILAISLAFFYQCLNKKRANILSETTLALMVALGIRYFFFQHLQPLFSNPTTFIIILAILDVICCVAAIMFFLTYAKTYKEEYQVKQNLKQL